MASRKNKGGRSRGKTQAPSRKSRLWLRDLLNILGGLVLGVLGIWLFQQYQANRAAKAVARQYVDAVSATLDHLKPLAEQYVALSEGKQEGEPLPEAELDVRQPLCSLEPFRNVLREACALPPDIVPLLLEFARNLQKAEMLRKLLEQEQLDPTALPRTMSGQLLLTVYEESRSAPNLLWKLKERAGKIPEKDAPGEPEEPHGSP